MSTFGSPLGRLPFSSIPRAHTWLRETKLTVRVAFADVAVADAGGGVKNGAGAEE